MGWGGRIYLLALWTMNSRFFFHVFSVVRCLAYRGNDFKTGLSTFEAIFGLLGQKYNEKSTLLSKFVPVIWPFWRPKKLFFELFESWFGDVQKFFGHCFWL